MTSTQEILTNEVDPSRLARGSWCHTRNRQTGEGDISASYSADTIGLHDRIRKPFRFRGAAWACVGFDPGGVATAYRLVHPGAFEGEVTTYAQRTRDSEAARNDPMGFYHGIRVSGGGDIHALCGPPERFAPGTPAQYELF